MFAQIIRADTQVCPYILIPLLFKERDRVRLEKNINALGQGIQGYPVLKMQPRKGF